MREVFRLDLGVRLADGFGIRLPLGGVIGRIHLFVELCIRFAGAFVECVWFARIDHSFVLCVFIGNCWDWRIVAQSGEN